MPTGRAPFWGQAGFIGSRRGRVKIEICFGSWRQTGERDVANQGERIGERYGHDIKKRERIVPVERSRTGIGRDSWSKGGEAGRGVARRRRRAPSLRYPPSSSSRRAASNHRLLLLVDLQVVVFLDIPPVPVDGLLVLHLWRRSAVAPCKHAWQWKRATWVRIVMCAGLSRRRMTLHGPSSSALIGAPKCDAPSSQSPPPRPAPFRSAFSPTASGRDEASSSYGRNELSETR